MTCLIWVPGTDSNLDQLFNDLREQQYQNRQDALWANYSAEAFRDCVALSIYLNDRGEPELCSSISVRPCWPEGVYRILNRTWKCQNRRRMMPEISQAMGQTALKHIQWLQENTRCRLYFISRETDNWMSWTQKNFKRQFGIEFDSADSKYLTCANENADTCWQHILYRGDTRLLDQWKKRH